MVTLNVFAGSPLPFLYGATRSLHNSGRLTSQIVGLKDLAADIICLQEVVCPRVLKAFKRSFPSSGFHCMYFSPERGLRRGVLVAWGMILLSVLAITALGVGFVTTIVPDATFGPTTATYTLWITLVTFATLVVGVLVFYMVRTSATYVWLTGIPTGLVIFVRKSPRLQVLKVTRHLFVEQHGDFLNVLNPRGFIGVDLVFDTAMLRLVNTHLNHGPATCRHRQAQVNELTIFLQSRPLDAFADVCVLGDLNVPAASQEVRSLCTSNCIHNTLAAGQVIPPETWSLANPLTHNPFIPHGGNRQLDFILTPNSEDRLVTNHCRRIFAVSPFLSDHFGILCDLKLVHENTEV
jgi:endonuclease/exonuclease/phosphatase family metal-dependent hydrolase